MKRVHESVDYVKHRDSKQLFNLSEQLSGVGIAPDAPVDTVHRLKVVAFSIVRDNAGNKYTVYLVHVFSGISVWEVRRRYNDFKQLNESLMSYSRNSPSLPAKTMFSNFSESFLEKRRADLETFLRSALLIPGVLKLPALRSFLWDSRIMLLPAKTSPTNTSAAPASEGTTSDVASEVSIAASQVHLDQVAEMLDVDIDNDEGAGFYSPLMAPRGSGQHNDSDESSCQEDDTFRQDTTPIPQTLGRPPTYPGSGRLGEQTMHSTSSTYTPRLRDFEMMRVLGKGSFGKVMLCRKRDTGHFYAMKVLKKQHVIKRKQVAHTRTERSVLGQVDHPFVVKLHYAFQTGDKLHFVLDFCSGGELFFHLGRAGRFSEHLGRFYAAEIALALGHLHGKGVVYRDLKPENILLDADGHIKLADFGLSKEGIVESVKGTDSFCGTPEYLAPEVLNRIGHGSAVDWWSLGALLYEMLTGLPPWYSQDRQKMFASIRSSDLCFPDYVTSMARQILCDFLERDVSKRLGSNGDIDEVRQHPFFGSTEWDKLYAKDIPSPFVPSLSSQTDISNFDSQFTRLPVLSVDNGALPAPHAPHSLVSSFSEQTLFDGFTYTPQSTLIQQMNRVTLKREEAKRGASSSTSSIDGKFSS